MAAALLACGGGGGAPSGEGAVGDTASRPSAPAESPDSLAIPAAGVAVQGGPAPAPLEGTAWVLFALPGAPAPPAGVVATLTLERDDGRILGSTGCRGFDGAYTLSGPQIEMGLSGMGAAPCEAEAARVERDYLAALRQVGSWRLLGDTLDLLGPTGVVARFHP